MKYRFMSSLDFSLKPPSSPIQGICKCKRNGGNKDAGPGRQAIKSAHFLAQGSDMDMGHTLVTSNGPWNSTLELVLRDCHSHPGQPYLMKPSSFFFRKFAGI